MNSTVRLNFKKKFTEIRTYKSCEQCKEATHKTPSQAQTLSHLFPNGQLIPNPNQNT